MLVLNNRMNDSYIYKFDKITSLKAVSFPCIITFNIHCTHCDHVDTKTRVFNQTYV